MAQQSQSAGAGIFIVIAIAIGTGIGSAIGQPSIATVLWLRDRKRLGR